MLLEISDTKIVKSNGPKMDPWGTPLIKLIQEDSPLSVITCCDRSVKYFQPSIISKITIEKFHGQCMLRIIMTSIK